MQHLFTFLAPGNLNRKYSIFSRSTSGWASGRLVSVIVGSLLIKHPRMTNTKTPIRLGAILIPKLMFLNPSFPKSNPWGMTTATEWNLVNMFSIFYLWDNKVWYKNRNLMIFELLTSSKGHQFDHSMKILLTFCSTRHPRRFDTPHDHIWKYLLIPWAHQRPKVTPWGMTRVTEWKSSLICFVSFICENTHKFGIKIFVIDMVTKINWYLIFWPHPRSPVWP